MEKKRGWRNVGVIAIPEDTTEEMLAIALSDLLNSDCIDSKYDSVKQACEVMGHPDLGYGHCKCRKIRYSADY